MKLHSNIEQGSPEWKLLRRQCVVTASEVSPSLYEIPACRMTIAEIKAALDGLSIEYPAKGQRDDFLQLLPEEARIISVTAKTEDARRSHIMKRLVAPLYEREDLMGYEFLLDITERNEFLMDKNAQVQRGKHLEPLARKCYDKLTGNRVIEVGMISADDMSVGVSPDGLIVRPDLAAKMNEGFAFSFEIESFSKGLEMKSPLPETHCRYLLEGVLPSEYEDQVHTGLALSELPEWDFFSFCPGLPPFLVTVTPNEKTEKIREGLKHLKSEFDSMRSELGKIHDTAFDGKWKEIDLED